MTLDLVCMYSNVMDKCTQNRHGIYDYNGTTRGFWCKSWFISLNAVHWVLKSLLKATHLSQLESHLTEGSKLVVHDANTLLSLAVCVFHKATPAIVPPATPDNTLISRFRAGFDVNSSFFQCIFKVNTWPETGNQLSAMRTHTLQSWNETKNKWKYHFSARMFILSSHHQKKLKF